MINIVSSPQILTDDIFVQYGGVTGTSTPAQRTAAYAVAEGQTVGEIGTFVAPTTATGTYSWPPPGQSLQLQHTYLSAIGSVTAIHDAGCDCAEDAIEISGCAWILDADGGLVSLRECGDVLRSSCSGCNCGSHRSGALQARIAYTAGLPAGAATDPRLLQGLTVAADLALQQVIDPSGAEAGPGDAGIESFSSLRYSEKRHSLRMTAFGGSARANYAANILRQFKFKRAMKLGW